MRSKGSLSAVMAYLLWGVLPIFWKQISYIPSREILAHRMVWSLLLVATILFFRKKWAWVKPFLRSPKTIFFFALSSFIIGLNWFIYIWAVNNNYIVEASLGYFINPLFSVVLGVFIFKEQLSITQWLAVALAFCGVAYLTFNYGRLPWVALLLAFFFGLYGLLRKIGKLDAAEGLFIEMSILFLPGLGFLIYLQMAGTGTFLNTSTGTDIFLLLTGAATLTPLFFFTYAAKRTSLSTLGILQYMAPVLQFLIGVFIYKENFTSSTLIGFIFIWAALAIYTWDLLRPTKRSKRNDGIP